MSNSIEYKADGSLALFIDGDLQFDSTDEAIYHEGLVLPALAIAMGRGKSEKRVLIIGGGDGLCARELFKCQGVAQVDLVDYDAEIVALAKSEFKDFNKASFEDSRLNLHVRDAWQFASEAIEAKKSYDLIISDLTVAADVDSARFHSVEWYTMLNRLLSDSGVVAINGVSPDATPWAYWSVFNSIAQSGLHPRPYHVTIPSFSAKGYGADWGFFLAAKTPISAQEIDACQLSQPRTFLTSHQTLRELFHLPQELFALQAQAAPALLGSAILLRYFNKGKLIAASGTTRDALEFDTANLNIPPADTGKELLPQEVSLALAQMIALHEDGTEAQRTSADAMLADILSQIPALQESHTPELIADFLSAPSSFLQGIDLPGLVERMLQHASQLPAKFVEELKALAKSLEQSASELSELASEHLTPRQLGSNFLMLLTLVLVVGNLLYPDMVYAKGAHGDHGHHGGYAGYNNGWGYNNGYGTTEIINRRPRNNETIIRPRSNTPDVQIKNYGKGNKQSLLPEAKHNLAQSLQATRAMLQASRTERSAHLAMLTTELNAYETSQSEDVLYGMHNLPKAEAIRRTQQAVQQVSLQLKKLEAQIAALPTLETLESAPTQES